MTTTQVRDHLAKLIVKHQPKPIPINLAEAQYIADHIVEAMPDYVIEELGALKSWTT